VNKSDDTQLFRIEISGAPESMERTGFTEQVSIGPLGEQVLPLVLQVPRARYEGRFNLKIAIHDGANTYTLDREIEFIGPDPRLLKDDK
jgi:hypothetical protein